MNEDPDPHTATSVLAKHAPFWGWLRKNVTPAILVTGVISFVGGVAYVVNLQHTIRDSQRQIEEGKPIMTAAQAKIADLEKSRDDLASQVKSLQEGFDAQTRDVQRLQAWQDHVEGVASTPLHARRRR